MRQAVFSSLGQRVEGARFIDLFAGSGAYGLEAMSRGAAGGVFVEQSAKAVACLRQNIAAVCKSLGRDPTDVSIRQMDAKVAPSRLDDVADLVFIDPPYEMISEMAPNMFSALANLKGDPVQRLVIFEMPGEIDLSPPGWTCVKRLGKGVRQPTVAFFRQNLEQVC
jgi:16S rRNA (guanine966-N2)-methyltransferase